MISEIPEIDLNKYPIAKHTIEQALSEAPIKNPDPRVIWFCSCLAALSLTIAKRDPTSAKEFVSMVHETPEEVLRKALIDRWAKDGAFTRVAGTDQVLLTQILILLERAFHAELSLRLLGEKWRIVHNSGMNFRIESNLED